jgi:hypothetical protein
MVRRAPLLFNRDGAGRSLGEVATRAGSGSCPDLEDFKIGAGNDLGGVVAGTTYGRVALMVKTTVYLDETIALRVRQLAKTKGRSQAEVIRDALETYTRDVERPRPKGIGAYSSGRSDISERAEEILREAARKRG